MCEGTKTHWRCKCSSRSCPCKCPGTGTGHPWDTHDYGAYFFCDAYLLSDLFHVGHHGIPLCPQGVTYDSETRYRDYLCPGCVDSGCPPIDHSIRFEDFAQNITWKQKGEIAKRGRPVSRTMSGSRTASRGSSTDTIRPDRSRSPTPTPVPIVGGLGQAIRAAICRAQLATMFPLQQQGSFLPGLPTSEPVEGPASGPEPRSICSNGGGNTQLAAQLTPRRGPRHHMIPRAFLQSDWISGPVDDFDLQGSGSGPKFTTEGSKHIVHQLKEWLTSDVPSRSPLPPLPGAGTGVWDAERIWRESQDSSPISQSVADNQDRLVSESDGVEGFVRAREDDKVEIEGPSGKLHAIGGRDTVDDVDGREPGLYDLGGPDPELYDVGGPDPEVHPELSGLDESQTEPYHNRGLGYYGTDEAGKTGAGPNDTGMSGYGTYILDRYGSEDI